MQKCTAVDSTRLLRMYSQLIQSMHVRLHVMDRICMRRDTRESRIDIEHACMIAFPYVTTTYLHNRPVFVEHHLAWAGRGLNKTYVHECTLGRTYVMARELMQRSTAVQRILCCRS